VHLNCFEARDVIEEMRTDDWDAESLEALIMFTHLPPRPLRELYDKETLSNSIPLLQGELVNRTAPLLDRKFSSNKCATIEHESPLEYTAEDSDDAVKLVR